MEFNWFKIHIASIIQLITHSSHLSQVKQTGIPPSDITFLVISGPLHGYLDIEGSEEDRIGDYEEKGGIKAFDQSTVNGGKLYYVESVANQTEDVVVIDVTNGVTWLRSLLVRVIYIYYCLLNQIF